MLVLAFDTATDVATSALLEDGRVLGEGQSEPRALLAEVDRLLDAAGATPADLGALVVGTGPGSFTSTRIGLATARGLALALELPVAGVSTLDALAAAADDASPSSTHAGGRSSSPVRARSRPTTSISTRARSASGRARFAIGRPWRRRARSSRPTTTRSMCRTHACTPRSRRCSARRRTSFRSTSARPTRR